MTSTIDTTAETSPAAQRWSRIVGSNPARLMLVLVILGWIANVAWRIWLSRGTAMPIAHADEDSYLNSARVIFGGPDAYSSENRALRRVGYPLLISPAFAFGQDFFTTYRIVQVINAMLNALVFPLAYLFARRVLRLERLTSYASAFAAATLPAVAFYSGVALTDVVLAPLILAWILSLYGWLRDPQRLGLAIASGALAGVFYLIHVRGVVIVGVHLGVAALLLYRHKISRRILVATSLSALVVAASNHVIIALLGDRLHLTGSSPGTNTIAAILSVSGAARLSATVGTQLWYLAVVTFGLAGLGWALAIREVWRPTRESAFRWLMGAALATTLGVAVGAAVILAGVNSRPGMIVYARYIHMLGPLWLLIGLSALFTLATRQVLKLAAFAVGFIAVGGGLVALRLWHSWLDGKLGLSYGAFGAPDLIVLTAGYREVRPLLGSFIAIGACIALVAASRLRRLWVPLALAVVVANVVMMGFVADRLTHPLSVARTPTPYLADLGVHPGDRLASNLDVDYMYRLAMEHQVTWGFVPHFKGDSPPAGTDVIIAAWDPGKPTDWDGTKYGYHRIGGNQAQRWAVWRR